MLEVSWSCIARPSVAAVGASPLRAEGAEKAPWSALSATFPVLRCCASHRECSVKSTARTSLHAMEPAAKKARGADEDEVHVEALSRMISKRTVDNAGAKTWQYNVIAWKSCEDFAQRLQASDSQRFQYHKTVWEKFDDSKMDHIIVGGFRPKNLISRCEQLAVIQAAFIAPEASPGSREVRNLPHCLPKCVSRRAGRTCCSWHLLTITTRL